MSSMVYSNRCSNTNPVLYALTLRKQDNFNLVLSHLWRSVDGATCKYVVTYFKYVFSF